MTPLEKSILEFVAKRQDDAVITGPKALATRSAISKAIDCDGTRHAVSRLWSLGYLRRPGLAKPSRHWQFEITDSGRKAMSGIDAA